MLASCGSRGADPARRPEARGDFSDQVLLWNGAEEARVVGVSAVVAHDEEVMLRHDHRTEGIDARYLAGS